MKQYILTAVLIIGAAMFAPAHAQLVTNAGDTITISNGTDLFIPGGFTLEENAGRYPYIYNNGTLEISGDFTGTPNSIYNGTTDSVILFGTDTQSFPGFSYGRFLVEGGSVKKLNGKAFIRNQILLNNGWIHTLNDTIQLDSVALMKEDSGNYVTGNMMIIRKLRSNINYQNGNIGLELKSLSFPPGNTLIFRKTGPDATQHGFCSNGIQRYFEITPSTNLAADLVFHYYDHELNGIPKSRLSVFNSADLGSTWTPLGYSTRDPVLGSVGLNATGPHFRYTLADELIPLINPLKAGKDTTICANTPVQIGGDSTPGHVYSWSSLPAGYSSSLADPVVSPTESTVYILTETVPATSCLQRDTIQINVFTKTPVGFSEIPVSCSGLSFTSVDSAQNGYLWKFGDGDSAAGYTTKHIYKKDSLFTITLSVTNAQGCVSSHDTTINFHARTLDYRIYPNPVLTDANIRFNLCENSDVSITVWNAIGQHIETVTDGPLNEGFYNFPVHFASHTYRPGMYFVRTTINEKLIVNKIVRIK